MKTAIWFSLIAIGTPEVRPSLGSRSVGHLGNRQADLKAAALEERHKDSNEDDEPDGGHGHWTLENGLKGGCLRMIDEREISVALRGRLRRCFCAHIKIEVFCGM